MKYFIQFSYNGAAYHGWQNQPNAITVQQVLEKAMSTLLQKEVAVMGAGRTDTGVHAKQMYAHFEVSPIDKIDDLIFRLNAILPDDIAVQNIHEVISNAHARFDAVSRTYEYWVVQEKNPFFTNAAHYVKNVLDVEKMNAAAELLLKNRDFQCFSKSNTDVYTYNCDIKAATWTCNGTVLVFTITADRFLRNMVRAIVGTLLDVGTGKSSLNDVKAIINSKDRSQAGTSVPAKALYLTQITYPKTLLCKHG